MKQKTTEIGINDLSVLVSFCERFLECPERSVEEDKEFQEIVVRCKLVLELNELKSTAQKILDRTQ